MRWLLSPSNRQAGLRKRSLQAQIARSTGCLLGEAPGACGRWPGRVKGRQAVPIADTVPAVAPKGSEPVVAAFVDKFMLGNKDTGLEKILKDKGITTVIAVGTAANGAVLYTSSAAALRGFNVIVPVDGMSAIGQNIYVEQYVAYNFTSAPIISPKITLTSIDMIKF